MSLRVFLACLVLVCGFSMVHGTRVCINGPAVYGGNIDEDALSATIALKPSCVRLVVRADVWGTGFAGGVMNSTGAGDKNLNCLETHKLYVDRYRDNKIMPYLLMSADSINQDITYLNTDDGHDQFVAATLATVKFFGSDVDHYELVNEPNNWVNGSPGVPAARFGQIVMDTHITVKLENGFVNANLMSGGLFTHALDDGSAYLTDVYNEWGSFFNQHQYYPVDGIGLHVYGPGGSESDVKSFMQSRANIFWGVIQQFGDTTKQIWLSEFGFQGDQQQVDGMNGMYDALIGDGRFAMAMWFTYQDFPGGPWGLYDQNGFSSSDRHPSYDTFIKWTGAKKIANE